MEKAHHDHTHNHTEHVATESGNAIYTCPMHPEIRQESPGMCPECGMSLVPAKRKTEGGNAHDKHAGHSTAMFLKKFWVSLILTVPVVLYSDIFQTLSGFSLPTLEIGNWDLGI